MGEDVTHGRLLALNNRQQLSFSAACAELLIPQSEEHWRTHAGEGSNALRAILDRLWTLATGEGEPDVWADADASFDLVPPVGPSGSSAAGARAAALAVHYSVRMWLVEQAYQAILAMDQAVTHGPSDASVLLGAILTSLEDGASPEEIRTKVLKMTR